jgi:hypothetical protein
MASAGSSSFIPTSCADVASVSLTPEELATLPFPVQLRGQNYALISCVAPPGWGTKRTANTLAMRIYGTFETTEQAQTVMKRAMSLGFTFFDLHIVDLSLGFFPLPPPEGFDPEIPTTYDHPVLTEVMKGHRDIINTSSEKLLDRLNQTPKSKVDMVRELKAAAAGGEEFKVEAKK